MLFYFRAMKPDFDWEIAKKAVLISLPILFSAFLGIFINLSDRFAIEKYGGLKDMSVYNFATTISGVIPFIFTSFQNVWLPQFLKEKDYGVNKARSKKMVIRLVVAFIAISIGLLVMVKGLLVFEIIDHSYDEIMYLLPIVLTTGIVTAITHMYSNHLIYMDKLIAVILVGVPVALLAIGLNLFLVPTFKIYGAAFSTLFINAFYLVSYRYVVRRYQARMENGPVNN
jgi:O-antigen/teichoic acid export membrane protein